MAEQCKHYNIPKVSAKICTCLSVCVNTEHDKTTLDFRKASVNRINYWPELESLPLVRKENEKDLICVCVWMFVAVGM